MATTAKGTPYVVSTDLVANYPTVSSDLATHIDAKLAYNAVSINAQTGTTYTFALADASEGKLVTASNAGSQTYTVPPQSSVTWAAGAVLRILNQGAGTVTIAAGSGVTINGTPLTLAQYKGAAIQRTAADTWTFIPFSGGVGNAVISDTPTGSYTGYQYWTYSASGTLNVTTAGFADVLVVGGGAGGSAFGGGGGGGGHLEITNAYLPTGALTVTVGAGGAAGTTGTGAQDRIGRNGGISRIANYYSPSGGPGGSSSLGAGGTGFIGGSGGGGAQTGLGGAGTNGLGNAGGDGSGSGQNSGGGGGGASAAGAAASGANGGNGGAGLANSYTGSSVTRAGGGGGGGTVGGTGGTGGGGAGSDGATATSGTINTGGGGGGSQNAAAGAGGSGVVIIRVAV